VTDTPETAPTNVNRSAGVPPAIQESSSPRPPLWASLIATAFGIGRMKPGPGTWGSVAAVILWSLVSWRIPPESRLSATVVAVMIVTLAGIPAATRIVRASGIKDPQFVVIDEVAGQLVALIGVQFAWKTFLASLILFRVFDILKPPPVRQLEGLPEGFGIVVDDLAAGLYALICMHLLLHFGLLIR
jgi:phosphatidylglycerophosphatase A